MLVQQGLCRKPSIATVAAKNAERLENIIKYCIDIKLGGFLPGTAMNHLIFLYRWGPGLDWKGGKFVKICWNDFVLILNCGLTFPAAPECSDKKCFQTPDEQVQFFFSPAVQPGKVQ